MLILKVDEAEAVEEHESMMYYSIAIIYNTAHFYVLYISLA